MPLSPRARGILEKIAAGKSYEQILAADPGLSYLDIFAAAREALRRTGAKRKVRPGAVLKKAPAVPVREGDDTDESDDQPLLCASCGVLMPGDRRRKGASICEECEARPPKRRLRTQ